LNRVSFTIIAGFLTLSTVSTSAVAASDPVVATVVRGEVKASDLRRLMRAQTPEALKRALVEAIDEHLLASQAATVLGRDVSLGSLSRAQRAARVSTALFSPQQLCKRIPMPMRRQHYDETRWRFVAPPAWTVEDTQLLCCKSPTECRTDAAAACVKRRAKEARKLRKAVAAGMKPAELEAQFPDLYIKRYTFYFDPRSTAKKKVDWRLQEVDRTIAVPVSRLKPGQLTSKPVASRFGYHVLRLVSQRPAISAPFDDPKTQALLRTELCPVLLIQQRQRTLQDLRRQTPFSIRDEALKKAFGDLWKP